MSSAATRIPPELFPHILNHVDPHGLAAKEAKQYLSACTLTCHYWATQCRPKLLSSLVLRSTEDIRNLCFFTLNPPGRLPPMLSCVRHITAETRLTEAPSWIHNLHIYLLSQLGSQMRSSSYHYQKYFEDGSASLPSERPIPDEVCLRLFGPLPKILRAGREVVSPHPLSAMLPRRFPAHYRLFTRLILEDIRFNDGSDFATVLGEIHLSTQQGIVGIILRNIGVENPITIDETSVFFLPTKLAGVRFAIHDCTHPASLLWISLMRVCTMNQTPQQSSTLRLSTEENKSILGVACTLMSNPIFVEGDLTVTGGKHGNDSKKYHIRQRLVQLCVVSRNGSEPLSPSFSFHVTPMEDEFEQYQISKITIDMDPSSFIRHGIAIRARGVNLFSWDWPMIAQDLQWLRPSTTVRITFPCYSQIPLFCDSQPNRDALKALASQFTLQVQYYKRPHDSATLAQVDNLDGLLDCWYTRFRRNSFVTSFAAVYNDMIHEAAAAAIATGDQIQALEYLDSGRELAWLQHCPLRTPLDQLQTLHPPVTDRLHNFCQTLLQNTALNQRISCDSHEYTLEYEALIAQIRELQGFESFPLRDETLPQISSLSACLDGPVVLFNIHPRAKSYAIALCNTSNGVHIPLPDLSYDHAQQLREELSAIISRFVQVRPRLPLARRRKPPKFIGFLAELWRIVVKPIIDVLSTLPSVSSESSKMLHITWCPTGPLTCLPLHAAGIYHYNGPPEETVMDYAVSSYTPTLRALLRPSPGPVANFTSARPPRVLVVSQPEPTTPDCSTLPGTRDEAGIVMSIIGESAHVLIDEEGTINAVLEGMVCHDWVHIACHSRTSSSHDTIDGVFELYDGRLTLSTLMSKHLPNAHLAVLSSCQTARDWGGEGLAEEPTSTYLAAGMLEVGYRSVVGSMWDLYDSSTPFGMARFYEVLMQQIQAGEALQPAYALYEATKELHEKYGLLDFIRWIPFVHYGL